MLIYVDIPLKPKEKETLSGQVGNLYEIRYSDEFSNDEGRLDVLKEADILFGNPKPELMSQAVNAQWIQLFTAGFEHYQQVKTRAIVTNMNDYYSEPCVETIIAGLMALYRKIHVFSI